MKWTKQPPKKAGYYWWCNFREHTPTILKVGRSGKELWADNGEYCFEVSKKPAKPYPLEDFESEEEREKMATTFGGQKFYMGEELWCEIPKPELNGETIEGEF